MQVLDIKEPSGMHQTIDFKEIISNNFLKLNSDKNLLNSIALSIRDWYRGNISFALLTRRTMLHVSFEEHLFANVKLIDIEMEKPELYIPKKQYV
jgi:7-keto-8-aminopelargonate synthetase-like enzyme